MRNIKDADFIVTTANAAAGANSAAIDLEQVLGGNVEALQVELAIPTEASLGDAKTLSYALQDSANGSSWAPVDPAVTTSITGAGGAGAVGKTVNFRLHPGTRRYIRIAQTATSSPGTLAGSFVVALKF